MRKIISHIGLIFAAALLALATGAHAEFNTTPSVVEILAKTPAANGVFVSTDKGGARHIQSGMVCLLSFPNLKLWHLQIYDSAKGWVTDVGCDYGRQGAKNM